MTDLQRLALQEVISKINACDGMLTKLAVKIHADEKLHPEKDVYPISSILCVARQLSQAIAASSHK